MDIVKAEAKVDEEGTNKLIDAALDLFSPATESLGLLGDAVRLARVSVATEITKKAKKIADANGLELNAPPLKFLVPYYEKSSAESDDDMLESWAKLLVASGIETNVRHLSYADLLSRMGPQEAKIIRQLVLSNETWSRPFEAAVAAGNQKRINDQAQQHLFAFAENDERFELAKAFQDSNMITSGQLMWFTQPMPPQPGTGHRYHYPVDPNETAPYYNLAAIGLLNIRLESFHFFRDARSVAQVCWAEVTALAVDFVRTLEMPEQDIFYYGG